MNALHLVRPVIAAGMAVFIAWPLVTLASDVFPGEKWSRVDPQSVGWSSERLRHAEGVAKEIRSTSVVIVQDGKMIAEWGEGERKVLIRSIRKSLLSGLYGIAVGEQKIDVDHKIGELRIDDKPPVLTGQEKNATVRHLLMSRSGVYHEAAAEPDSMKANRPARGSSQPGERFFYNNWDFNALGTVYNARTGDDVISAFMQRVAVPIGMESFKKQDGWYEYVQGSVHPAYHFRLTARDLARFGWLYVNQGAWQGRQIVPSAWVSESTAAMSDVRPGVGYGYMWWVPTDGGIYGNATGANAYWGEGLGGQYLVVMPARKMVVAHLFELAKPTDRVTGRQFFGLLHHILNAAPLCEACGPVKQ